MAHAPAATPAVEDWTLTERTARVWTAASVALTIIGLALFLTVHGMAAGEVSITLHGWRFLATVALAAGLTLPLYVLHEAIHGLVMRPFGARPRYGWGKVAGMPGYLYCTADGHRFTRGQYAAVALAPSLIVSAVGTLAVVVAPFGGWLVVPLAFHFGGCVGDFAALWLVLRRPSGTTIEDRATGMRFYLPRREM